MSVAPATSLGYPQEGVIHSGKFNFFFNFLDSGVNFLSNFKELTWGIATKRVQHCDKTGASIATKRVRHCDKTGARPNATKRVLGKILASSEGFEFGLPRAFQPFAAVE